MTFWTEKIVEALDGPQLVNDSKTPSGRVHVGSLRGVLIHDAIFRTLKIKGLEARYTYGVDDYDPLDELPAGRGEEFISHLGKPLCNVPPPIGSLATDMAEHYIQEFFQVFAELGVVAETYRLRDVYRTGTFDAAIDRILSHGEVVRRVYLEVSGAKRPADWLPLQVVCECCGRIGTTEVTGYDGKQVNYHCRVDLVKWARGCGYRGSVSPFGGRAKLPWKLEWVAKWATFGVTIEGAGKDHTTRGGSREVASAALKEIYGLSAPLNIPYEFFLVEGAKMSSSKGIGASARDVADLLTPEALRFLMLNSLPKRPVNFSLAPTSMVKLFNDLDRLAAKAGNAHDENLFMRLCTPSGNLDQGYRANFQLLTALVQIPGVNVEQEIAKRKGSQLTQAEALDLQARLQVVRRWLQNYAPDDAKFEVQKEVPAAAATLTETQRAFLESISDQLKRIEWQEDAIQKIMFDTARMIPIGADQAFRAVYLLFLGRDSGPKAGCLLSALDRTFVSERLAAVRSSRRRFWQETSTSVTRFEEWLAENAGKATDFNAQLKLDLLQGPSAGAGQRDEFADGIGVIEITYLIEGKRHLQRVEFASIRVLGNANADDEARRFGQEAADYLENIAAKNQVVISVSPRVELADGIITRNLN